MDSKWAKSRKREEVIGRDSPSKTLKMARKNDSKRTEKDSKWAKNRESEEVIGRNSPSKRLKNCKKKKNGMKKTQNWPKIEKLKRLLGGAVPPKD